MASFSKKIKFPTVVYALAREGKNKVYVGPRAQTDCGVTLTVGDGTEVISFVYSRSGQGAQRGGDSNCARGLATDNKGKAEKATKAYKEAGSSDGGNANA